MNPRKLNHHPQPQGLLSAFAELIGTIIVCVPALFAWILLTFWPLIAIAWLIVMLCRK